MILIFGKHGQVATALRATLPAADSVFLGKDEFDLINYRNVGQKLDQYAPDTIIVCSAYTQVDKAEQEKDLAEAINHFAPAAIGKWAQRNSSRVLHYSTDYVYPGDGNSAWSESDPTGPLNWYGKTKLRGEKALLENNPDSIVLRTSWVYSHIGANFVKTMLRLGAEREQLSIVCDQVGSPTYAPDLAAATQTIITQWNDGLDLSGAYNCAGAGYTNWWEFATEIFEIASNFEFNLKVKSVLKTTTAEYKTPALRPLNSRLNQTKLNSKTGVTLPPWRSSLKVCIGRIRENREI